MSENFYVIKFKYEHGAYDIKDLIDLVPYFITEDEFFEITRVYYDIVVNKNKKREIT